MAMLLFSLTWWPNTARFNERLPLHNLLGSFNMNNSFDVIISTNITHPSVVSKVLNAWASTTTTYFLEFDLRGDEKGSAWLAKVGVEWERAAVKIALLGTFGEEVEGRSRLAWDSVSSGSEVMLLEVRRDSFKGSSPVLCQYCEKYDRRLLVLPRVETEESSSATVARAGGISMGSLVFRAFRFSKVRSKAWDSSSCDGEDAITPRMFNER